MVFKSWNSSCSLKNEGDFGIKEILSWNKALLLRWIWGLHVRRDSIWCSWVNAYLLRHDDVWAVQIRSDSSESWRGLLRIRDDFVACVGSVIAAKNLLASWSDFDVSMAYNIFRGQFQRTFRAKTTWSPINIPCHCYISTLTAQGQLATIDNIFRRGLPIPNRCVLCKSAEENHLHLFFKCRYSSAFWGDILSWLQLPNRCWGLARELYWFKNHIFVRHWRSNWSRCALVATIYTIWMERNMRIFQGLEPAATLVRKIRFLVSVRMLGFSCSMLHDEIVDCLNA
ncbi:hypothetical protein RND81_12G094700 [Saponaria officinalis]|uniref:Reverse transcriptase zinc-binding domain-containing protein n=1 Tax=Saponaria officinalis TaxID=3572 RepID=A0AAW1H8I5_SAPOF